MIVATLFAIININISYFDRIIFIILFWVYIFNTYTLYHMIKNWKTVQEVTKRYDIDCFSSLVKIELKIIFSNKYFK